jgi:homoserine/homoserine lactone efflux protein
VVIDILVMWFFFAAAARSFQRFTRTARGQMVLSKVFGVLFVAVGILLAVIH